MPRLSLCSTNYDTSPITSRSLASILQQSEGFDPEVVIVDNYSTDGSYEALTAYPASVPLRVARRKCSRGLGRQVAYEMSRGDYIATFDLDTVYDSRLGQLLRWAFDNRIQFGLQTNNSLIVPRFVLDEVGGWRDLQCCEDVDLCARLAVKGLFRDYAAGSGENFKRSFTTNLVSRWLRLYSTYRDHIAVYRWIPLRLFLGGYASLRKRDRSAAYYFSVFVPAFVAALRKRKLLGEAYPDLSQCMDPRVQIDCGIVSPRDLTFGSPYATRSEAEEAAAKGDFRFLPTGYE